jgi:DnaK suppressor protein
LQRFGNVFAGCLPHTATISRKAATRHPTDTLLQLAGHGYLVYKAPSLLPSLLFEYRHGTQSTIKIFCYTSQDDMNSKQQAHFRKILQTLKDELLGDVERTVHTMQEEATVFADPNDRASQESDIALELRNRDRERKLIKKIDEALERIEKGEYGYCDSCGVEISVKRLEARPTATLCIDCKTLEEMREKQLAK